MKKKTISAHYDSVYSLEHNNRNFIPKNVDPARIQENYNLVNAGEVVTDLFPDIKDLSALWNDYRQLTQAYWRSYYEEQVALSNKIWEIIQRRARFEMALWENAHYDESPIVTIIGILMLPILFTATIASAVYTAEEIVKIEVEKDFLQSQMNEFRWSNMALREALREKDRIAGTSLLRHMDELVWKSEIVFEALQLEPTRFATIEEVYQKVFEPEFQAFQAKQRKCRRYNGTYLEQIRERQLISNKSKNRNEKTRTTTEAIEIVFGIGDMDNTGYIAAPEDAKKSEALLKDFCQHLLAQPNVCTITTLELNDPTWKPPFKHGLILVNLVGHFDEATPGIHATFIPYSRGCKRGPDTQPSLGRALTGMGYPSTWKNILDSNGNPIPKTDRYGKVILNEDGSARSKKEPDQQGIIDWIENQKMWIQKEMRKRYNWDREYKGSHPRGNLSVPDYKAARAQERVAEAEQHMKLLLQKYYDRCAIVANSLQQSIENSIEHDPDLELILNYVKTCSDERYEALLLEAVEGMKHLSDQEKENAHQALQNIINVAKGKRQVSPVSKQNERFFPDRS